LPEGLPSRHLIMPGFGLELSPRLGPAMRRTTWEGYSPPWWVGAHLAVSAPPGTVRAPLDAYGSTSETAEWHIVQRGHLTVSPESGLQVGFGPLEDQTQVAPIVVATSVLGDNVVQHDFGPVFKR
jgi:hypothetical protein